jgi:two-component sensor histidine kinase
LGTGIVVVVYLIIMSDIVGFTKIMSYIPDLILHAVVLEALILSLAFIDRYKILQEEKEEADYLLLKESKEREEKIKIEVTSKTHQLQEALQTQELLFKELHHRVKNNLQMILSINDLQKEEYENPMIRDIFQKWENRIQAIAKTHELIYMHNDIEMIDMSDYIERLIENIEDSYLTNDIIFKYDINCELSLDKAIYIGLIINELVSNSIKYAFENKKGEISIILNNDFLKVSDNGKGYDIKNINLYNTGLNLMTILAQEQLNAVLDIDNNNGISYTLRFNREA